MNRGSFHESKIMSITKFLETINKNIIRHIVECPGHNPRTAAAVGCFGTAAFLAKKAQQE
jgi:hypothetical protein